MLKVAIQMDPIEAVNIEADTTFLQAITAQARGHRLWVYDVATLALEDGRLFCRARPVTLRQTVGDHVTFGAWVKLDLAEDIDVLGQIQPHGVAEVDMVALAVPQGHRPRPAEQPSVLQRQGPEVIDPLAVAARLGLHRHHEGGVGPDVDRLDRVHLYGDTEHGGPLNDRWDRSVGAGRA